MLMQIEHLIFLIHPCCYEPLDPDSPLHRSNIVIYIDREREVKQRWLAELAEQSASTLLLQLYGPRHLHASITDIIGEARTCYVQANFSDIAAGPEHLRVYYRRLTNCIREHLQKYKLTFDARTVTAEIWGESFEGCCSLYSSAFAENLGLQKPPQMRFDMTVFDTRMLYGAAPPEILSLPGTDLEALLFKLYDQTSAAIFQSRLQAQFYDDRMITLQLDPGRIQVCNTRGHTLWPTVPPRQAVPQEPVPFSLKTGETCWVHAMAMSFDELRDVVRSATVKTS